MSRVNTRRQFPTGDRARMERAAIEPMGRHLRWRIVPTGKPGVFTVQTKGGVYEVDIQARTCDRATILPRQRRGVKDALSCRDFTKRLKRRSPCKHAIVRPYMPCFARRQRRTIVRVTNGKRMLQGMLLFGTTTRLSGAAGSVGSASKTCPRKRTEWQEAV